MPLGTKWEAFTPAHYGWGGEKTFVLETDLIFFFFSFTKPKVLALYGLINANQILEIGATLHLSTKEKDDVSTRVEWLLLSFSIADYLECF